MLSNVLTKSKSAAKRDEKSSAVSTSVSAVTPLSTLFSTSLASSTGVVAVGALAKESKSKSSSIRVLSSNVTVVGAVLEATVS